MEEHRPYLEAAMEEAYRAYIKRTYPVGAVIVNPHGDIISRGHNQVYSEGDFTKHAEVEAIRWARHLLMQKENFAGCTLYTTWEPCLMCCGSILLARIKRVIWLMNDSEHGMLQHLKDNKDRLLPYYRNILHNLEFSAANERDLTERMKAWMDEWDKEKERVQSHWREKDKQRELSLV